MDVLAIAVLREQIVYVFKTHILYVAPIYKPQIVCRRVLVMMTWTFRPDAAMPASISPDVITWEGVECALGLMQRLFGLDCSALRCVDIKLSVTNLHVSTVKFERYTCTVTDALATHMQTNIERYVAYVGRSVLESANEST